MDDFNDIVGAEEVTVVVGSSANEKTYTMSKALLCKLPWFEAAFERDRYREGVTGHVTLPDDQPEAFEALQYYLTYRVLEFPALDFAMDDKQFNCELQSCLLIWVFGDKYDVPYLQNASMLRLCDLLTHRASQDSDEQLDNRDLVISLATLLRFHDLTLGGSPLRILMADYIVYQVRKEKQVPYSHFRPLQSYDGFRSDYESARNAYRRHRDNKKGAQFPRYLQPYKYEKLFSVKEGNDGKEDDAVSIGYGWKQMKKEGCMECKSDKASCICFDCGNRVAGDARQLRVTLNLCQQYQCHDCRSLKIGSLCGDCGATYQKSSVAEQKAEHMFLDKLLRSQPIGISERLNKKLNDHIRLKWTNPRLLQ